jgi:homocysteine S-methyltransferase
MSEITILDGGMGQELIARAPEGPTPLWATQVMMDHPEIVRAIHEDYFTAGAQVATANTYAVLRDRLTNNGIADQFEALHQKGREIACQARDAFGAGKVASSLGPLGASYRPDLAPSVADAATAYAEIIALHDEYVDLHIIETASGLQLAEGALAGCEDATKPIWIALSVDDADGTLLRSGNALKDALPLLDKYGPSAVLINCSTPEAVTQALPIIAAHGMPFGAYANGFTKISDAFKVVNQTVDTLTARTDLGPDAYADFAEQWAGMGATIIGGCCEVGPAHIAELNRRFG